MVESIQKQEKLLKVLKDKDRHLQILELGPLEVVLMKILNLEQSTSKRCRMGCKMLARSIYLTKLHRIFIIQRTELSKWK